MLSNFAVRLTHIFMRKIILFVVLLISLTLMSTTLLPYNCSDSQKVILKKEPVLTGASSRPRSIIHLEAYYDSCLRTIEISNENLGNCDLYIEDESGNIIDQKNIYSSDYSIEILNLADTKGSITIIINSDVIYAYGTIYIQ